MSQSKYYIHNEIYKYGLHSFNEGDRIVFEMPSFCSGVYDAVIQKDKVGFFINNEDNHFKGCRDFQIIKTEENADK